MINNSTIMGRLTFDPDLKTVGDGISVVNFQVAVDRKYQKQGEERKADFIDCIAWRNTADFINSYFHRGSMIAIEGSIQTDTFTDKDGNKRKSVKLAVNNVSFCGSKNDSGVSTSETAGEPFTAEDEEGLPF